MTLTKEQTNEFESAAEPLIEWLNENCHPHVKAIVGPGSAELLETMCFRINEDYIKD